MALGTSLVLLTPPDIPTLVSYVLGILGLERYLANVAAAVYGFISERKLIKPMSFWKKLWFCLTFPLFDVIGRIASFIAVFIKVDWKPIPHNSEVKISDLQEEKEPVAK